MSTVIGSFAVSSVVGNLGEVLDYGFLDDTDVLEDVGDNFEYTDSPIENDEI